MKKVIIIFIFLSAVPFGLISKDTLFAQQTILLLPQEIEDIRTHQELYAYFGPAVSSITDDMVTLKKYFDKEHISNEYLTHLCAIIEEGKTTAPITLIETALADIINYGDTHKESLPEEVFVIIAHIKTYYSQFSSGLYDLDVAEINNTPTITRRDKKKKFCSLIVKRKLCAGCLKVKHNAKIGGNLTVEGDSIVEGTLTVNGEFNIDPTDINTLVLIGVPQEACIIFRDAALNEKARICSSPIEGDKGIYVSVDGGVTQNVRVTNGGAITIAPPSGGETGLTINGGGELINAGNLTMAAGNIILPVANAGGTQGLLQLGGTGATNVSVYEIGTRNLFAGNGAVNAGVSGTDNISIGSSANSTLTTGNFTVALGNTATATATDSVAIGDAANATAARTIAIGSRDSTSTGFAPTATATNAIAIGSAQAANAGASATGLSSVALGGADGAAFGGASSIGNRSIAVGLNAISTGPSTITLGSASGTAGGNGPRANVDNGIAIGSANGTLAGAVAGLLVGGNIAIGGADGVFAGAIADGGRAIAIGVNPRSALDACILIGSASGTVGGTGPVVAERSTLAIGSAQGTQRATNAFNQTTIAIGGSDGTFPGAVALGMRSISIGANSATTPNTAMSAIAIGSASGTAGGLGATAGGISSVVLGSASGTFRGALGSTANTVAIGSSDGTSAGAAATAARAVSIGTGTTNAQVNAIVLGRATNTAVHVGIGTAAPAAKLDIVGVDGTPIITLNQVNTSITNAPAILNRSSAAVAGTPIHYNASNQLFGFTSSKRYKTNIRSLDTSSIIYNINPVVYDPKHGYGEGKNIPGFIAEDVYKVAPQLVILNETHEPETIAYDLFHALAIKEIQNHKEQLEVDDRMLYDHKNILDNLLIETRQLQTRIEKLVH